MINDHRDLHAVCQRLNNIQSLTHKLFVVLLVPCLGNNMQENEHQPEFLAPLDNFTVTQGRDISFTCVVNDLGPYRVSASPCRTMQEA